jgi:hypothetical protein
LDVKKVSSRCRGSLFQSKMCGFWLLSFLFKEEDKTVHLIGVLTDSHYMFVYVYVHKCRCMHVHMAVGVNETEFTVVLHDFLPSLLPWWEL